MTRSCLVQKLVCDDMHDERQNIVSESKTGLNDSLNIIQSLSGREDISYSIFPLSKISCCIDNFQ